MNLKKLVVVVFSFVMVYGYSQSIGEHARNVSQGTPSGWYDNRPGSIIYPTGYSNYSSKTPVIFVHGIFGKVSGSWDANIQEVQNFHVKAAFVQLNPTGSTYANGKLLSRIIDKVRSHYNCQTVSIVAHSKGGMDTERALYGQNPYTGYSYPSHSYEKVDAVYTLSSPLRGARVADVGSALSFFGGVTWAAMWYTNGWSLTSGTVNSFHNSARSWRVTSNYTFKNYYNPYGRSYVRNNLSQDNTTRWWAHQSNDECYRTSIGWVGVENMYCYLGRPFHHSVGAYYDAYWEWDWFNSGFRNWHSNSDGFISEYRAKRVVNVNTNPSFTPGAGNSNYRTMLDANHTSLWEANQNHFTNEIGPYLHYGLYNFYGRSQQNNSPKVTQLPKKESVEATLSSFIGSSGNAYFAKGQNADLIIENTNEVTLIVYCENKLKEIALIDRLSGERFTFKVDASNIDQMSSAYASVITINSLNKGVYELDIKQKNYLALADYGETDTAFAVNFNFDEKIGYNGEQITIGIANKTNAIDFENVHVNATISKITMDQNTPIDFEKVSKKIVACTATDKEGFYAVSFANLTPGSSYSIRIEAISKTGNVLFARNVINTFFVKKEIEIQDTIVHIQEEEITPSFIVNVYPNPASEFVKVTNYSKTTINTIALINKSGTVIKEFDVNAIEFKINLKNLRLEKGFYMLKIQTNNNSVIKKLYIK